MYATYFTYDLFEFTEGYRRLSDQQFVRNCSTNQRRGNGRNTEESDQISFGLVSSIMSSPKFYISPMSGLSPNAQQVLKNTKVLEQQ